MLVMITAIREWKWKGRQELRRLRGLNNCFLVLNMQCLSESETRSCGSFFCDTESTHPPCHIPDRKNGESDGTAYFCQGRKNGVAV